MLVENALHRLKKTTTVCPNVMIFVKNASAKHGGLYKECFRNQSMIVCMTTGTQDCRPCESFMARSKVEIMFYVGGSESSFQSLIKSLLKVFP